MIIRNVRLFDGASSPARDRQSLVLEGDRIAWLGPTGDEPRPPDAAVIDGHGATLMPGLIDCHTHLGMGGGDAEHTPRERLAADGALRAVANARRCLDLGVTAVRDLGAPTEAVVAFAAAVERGEVEGPAIIAAARFIAPLGGYIAGYAREAASAEEAGQAAREQVAAGAGVLKVIASPVPPHPGERPVGRSFGVPALRAVAEVAHAAGLRVTAHAHGLEGARDAVEAGVDCIEHGYRLDDATIAAMAERGVWLVPTMVAMESAQAAAWRTGPPTEEGRRAGERWEAAVEAVRAARRAGVRVATGSDGPSIVPLERIRREVRLLVEHGGYTPAEALHAATGAAAALLGIEAETGTLTADRRADLVLIDGDPLADPGCLDRVRAVWRAGRRVR